VHILPHSTHSAVDMRCTLPHTYSAHASILGSNTRPLTHTYAQFGELIQSTPYQLTAVVDGPSEPGFSALVGRGDAAHAPAIIKLLIAIQDSNCTAVQLTVNGLPPATTSRYSVVLTNQSVVQCLELIDPRVEGGGGLLLDGCGDSMCVVR
jgi:hypothetical protein